MLEPFAERAEALYRFWVIALTAHCRSLICAAEGDLDGAERLRSARSPSPEDNGWPLQLGRALLRARMKPRRLRPRLVRRSSRRSLSSMAWVPPSGSSAPAGSFDGSEAGGLPAGRELSETEARIVELVAVGQSNKEVASALHLSPRRWSGICRRSTASSASSSTRGLQLAATRSTEK